MTKETMAQEAADAADSLLDAIRAGSCVGNGNGWDDVVALEATPPRFDGYEER